MGEYIFRAKPYTSQQYAVTRRSDGARLGEVAALDRPTTWFYLLPGEVADGSSRRGFPTRAEAASALASAYRAAGITPRVEFKTGYFDRAITSLGEVIEEAKRDLAGVDFDTLVGTGFSGGVVVPALALALGKPYVLVRKEHDDSHHGGGRVLGSLGTRWIFVDDFVCGGGTKRRVLDKIETYARAEGHQTTYVGDYLYAHVGDHARRWRSALEA